jgi:hypothetical protein
MAIVIHGLPGWWQPTTAVYAYATDPCRCPVCGGVGWVWHGWFTCDGTCQAVALVSDGRTFLPSTLFPDEEDASCPPPPAP